MIRVLHCELAGGIGGIETFLLNLSRCVDKSRFSFEILTRKKTPLKTKFQSMGIEVNQVPENISGYAKGVKELVSKGSYDIIHVHKNSAANIILPLIVKHCSSSKIIVHAHNTKPAHPNMAITLSHYINKPILTSLADAQFACSDLAAKWLFGSSNNAQIINNGIIAEDYDFDYKTRIKIRDSLGIKDKYVIGNIARFTKQKNHRFLIDIINRLDKSFLLLLAGDGDLRSETEAYVNELGLSDRVIFLGVRNDIKDILQAMDLVAMPSLYEGLPVSCIEAQAAGLPVLLSYNSSKMCAITDNIKFLPIDNVDIWCKHITEARESFHRESAKQQIVSSGFDITYSAEKIFSVYSKLCGGK